MAVDNREKHTGWTVRPGSALFPIAHSCGLKSKLGGERNLAQPEASPQLPHVN